MLNDAIMFNALNTAAAKCCRCVQSIERIIASLSIKWLNNCWTMPQEKYILNQTAEKLFQGLEYFNVKNLHGKKHLWFYQILGTLNKVYASESFLFGSTF